MIRCLFTMFESIVTPHLQAELVLIKGRAGGVAVGLFLLTHTSVGVLRKETHLVCVTDYLKDLG